MMIMTGYMRDQVNRGIEPNAVEAAHIANCAAGIVVGKIGVAVTDRKELIERIQKEMEK